MKPATVAPAAARGPLGAPVVTTSRRAPTPIVARL
jgi:hypothetical protein